MTTKIVEWPLIVEYFTKRGRPLSKEELNKLIEEERREREEEEKKRRLEEETKRRNLARMMQDLEEK
jgi:hypothetical protein